jgi:hypothetical protein
LPGSFQALASMCLPRPNGAVAVALSARALGASGAATASAAPIAAPAITEHVIFLDMFMSSLSNRGRGPQPMYGLLMTQLLRPLTMVSSL